MKDIIDPVEIKSITSNTPITITFNDGSTITAYNFFFNNEPVLPDDQTYMPMPD